MLIKQRISRFYFVRVERETEPVFSCFAYHKLVSAGSATQFYVVHTNLPFHQEGFLINRTRGGEVAVA